jgi:hypothetical protein
MHPDYGFTSFAEARVLVRNGHNIAFKEEVCVGKIDTPIMLEPLLSHPSLGNKRRGVKSLS